MDADEDERAAIMAVLKAETEAWLRRDFEALAGHWVQAPEARTMASFFAMGTHVVEGWEAIAANYRRLMEEAPHRYDDTERLTWDRLNIVVGADMAWVSYDLTGTDTGDAFELAGVNHELKIFQRVDGIWKIACMVILQRGFEHAACPVLEVDARARVLWMNGQARQRMDDHPGLVIAARRLRARRREYDDALREAIAWASRHVHGMLPARLAPRHGRAVPLGEDAGGAPLFCWVQPEDGKIVVSFDDARMVARRIETAAAIYGLSPAQVRLARLIVGGQDLTAAADLLGVSVNTLRTQLQRMFDKTGARSQPSLVRALLSAEVPTG